MIKVNLNNVEFNGMTSEILTEFSCLINCLHIMLSDHYDDKTARFLIAHAAEVAYRDDKELTADTLEETIRRYREYINEE